MTTKHKNTVLIVDDEPAIREALALYLQDYNVLTADGVPAAMALLKNHSPAVAILDVRLSSGGREGFEIAAALRKNHPETRLVFVSGLSDLDLRTDLLAVGAVAILQKPVNREGVVAAVAAAAREFALHDQKNCAIRQAARKDARKRVAETIEDALCSQTAGGAVMLVETHLSEWAGARARVFRLRGSALQCSALWVPVPEGALSELRTSGATASSPGYAVLALSSHREVDVVVGLESADNGAMEAGDIKFLRSIALRIAMMWFQCETYHAAQVSNASPGHKGQAVYVLPPPTEVDLRCFFAEAERHFVRHDGAPVMRIAHEAIVREVAAAMLSMARESVLLDKPFSIEVFQDGTVVAHSSDRAAWMPALGTAALYGYPVGFCERGRLGGSSVWVRF